MNPKRNMKTFFLIYSLVFFVCPISLLSFQGSSIDKEYLNGLHWMGKGRYDKAINIFQKIIRNDRSSTKAYVKMVEAYRWNHTLNEGLSYLKVLIQNNTANPYAYYGMGLIYKEKKEYSKALEQYLQTIKLEPGYCRVYQDLVDAFNQTNNLKDAANEIEDQIRSNPNNAAAYYGQGYLYFVQSNWESAMKNLDQSIQMDSSSLNAYHIKAAILFNTSRYQELLEISRTGLKLAENVNDVELQGIFLGNIGYANYFLSNYPQAIICCNQALKKAREIGNISEEVRVQQFLGNVHREMGKWSEALDCFKDALKKSQMIGDRKREGLSYQGIGTVYQLLLSDFSKALNYYKKALPIAIEIGDKNSRALVVYDIGSVNWNLGNPRQAMKYLKDALQIAEEINNQFIKQMCLGIMGLVYWNLGQYSEATNCYENAIELARKYKIKNWEGIHLGNLAIIFTEMGDQVKALEYYNQALKIAIENSDKSGEGRHLGNIACTYDRLGQYDKALEYYQKAVDLEKQIGNKKHEADFLGDIGNLYITMGKYGKADTTIEKALQLARHIKDKRCEAYQYLNLGDLNIHINNTAQSLFYYKSALDLGNKIIEPEIVWAAHSGAASAYEKLGEYENSLNHYALSIKKIEDVREVLQTEKYKTSFMENKLGVYENVIHLLTELDKKYPLKGYDVQSFHYAEMAKARVLLDMMCQGKILHNLSNIPGDIQKNVLINENSLEKKYEELSEELNKSNDLQNHDRVVQIEKEVETLQSQKTQLFEQLKKRHPEYYKLTHTKLLSVREIQNKILDNNQILIEYYVGDTNIFVWVLAKQKMDVYTIYMNRKSLEDALSQISPMFAKEKNNTEIEIDHRWANFNAGLLHKLYKILLKDPAEKYLKKDKELIIIPDGILHYFPFEILVTDMKEDKVQYLVENHPISYSSSSSLLNPELQRTRNAKKNLLAIGNPSFTSEQKKGILDWISALDPMKIKFRGGGFEPLPYAEQEVKAIGEKFSNSAVLIGNKATESNFKKMATEFRYIHLATHYVTSDKQPMYSKIVLAQNGDHSENDGYLQTYEIYNLKLNADLIVLSGCGTGLGKLSRGEGLIGMSRAFLHAGAPSMVVSLWPVEDASTASLMDHFYGYLKKGLSKSRALQLAKMEMLHSKDTKQDPFYWSPFVLIGDSKEIKIK
jgi:CHAT domain-containing protein/Tfp pilus assembly protein PilF